MSGIPTELRQYGAAVPGKKDPERQPNRASDPGAPVSGIILAGGCNSRMGSCKAELSFGKTDLIHFQAEKLHSIGVTDILISGYDVPVDGTRFIPDIFPHQGPLSGMHASLSAAENDACLVLSVDAPLVPPDFLKTLIRSHTRGITMAAHETGRASR